jgi:hypothetical protein
MEHQMSEFANDLLNPERTARPKLPCKVGLLIAALPEDEAEALRQAVERVRASTSQQGRNRVYSSVWLSKVLKKHGHLVGNSTVLRHVNKECNCE